MAATDPEKRPENSRPDAIVRFKEDYAAALAEAEASAELTATSGSVAGRRVAAEGQRRMRDARRAAEKANSAETGRRRGEDVVDDARGVARRNIAAFLRELETEAA